MNEAVKGDEKVIVYAFADLPVEIIWIDRDGHVVVKTQTVKLYGAY